MRSVQAYSFETSSGLHYEVRFARREDNYNSCNLAFSVVSDEFEDDEYAITNKGEVYRIMHTVVEVVKQYLKEHPNTSCLEVCAEPSSNRPKAMAQRKRLYKRYMPAIFNEKWKLKETHNKLTIMRV